MSPRLSFRCDQELVELVDQHRGRVPRERYLRDLVRDALNQPMTGPKLSGPARPAADPQRGQVQPVTTQTGAGEPLASKPSEQLSPIEAAQQRAARFAQAGRKH